MEDELLYALEGLRRKRRKKPEAPQSSEKEVNINLNIKVDGQKAAPMPVMPSPSG